MILTAYSPLGHGHLLKNPHIQKIAKKHETTVAQVCLARLLQQGCVAIPKSQSLARLQENLASQKLILDDEDFVSISSLPQNHRYLNPPFAPKRDNSD